MHNDLLPFLVLHTLLPGRRSRERQRKRWIENIKEDLEQRGSSIPQAAEKWKDSTSWKVFIQPIVGTLEERQTGVKKKKERKTDRQTRERKLDLARVWMKLSPRVFLN